MIPDDRGSLREMASHSPNTIVYLITPGRSKSEVLLWLIVKEFDEGLGISNPSSFLKTGICRWQNWAATTSDRAFTT